MSFELGKKPPIFYRNVYKSKQLNYKRSVLTRLKPYFFKQILSKYQHSQNIKSLINCLYRIVNSN